MSSLYRGQPSGTRHRLKTPDGVELEVREWGDPDGPELLLVPGVAQSYLSFVRQYSAPELQRFRIVSYDPRGHGLSGKPLGDDWYLGRRWSDEVRTVIEGVSLRRPVLAGWSLGGRIVRQYLVDYGDSRLGGVAFVSCRPVEVPEVVGPGNKVMGELLIDDEASRIDVATQFLRNCFGRQPEPDDFTFMLAFNMLCPFEIRLQIGKWLTPPEISSEALRRVEVPTWITHGTADTLILPLAAEMTASLIPHAELSLVEGAGHSIFFEQPGAFNAGLARFVDSVIAGQPGNSTSRPAGLRATPLRGRS